MPGMQCAVAACTNSYFKTKRRLDSVSYFRFPKNDELKKIWVERCKRKHSFNPNTSYVCSDHFKAEDFVKNINSWAQLMGFKQRKFIDKNAVPPLNLLPNEDNKQNEKINKRKDRNKHKKRKKEIQDLLNDAAASETAEEMSGAGSNSDKPDNTDTDYKLEYLKLKESFEKYKTEQDLNIKELEKECVFLEKEKDDCVSQQVKNILRGVSIPLPEIVEYRTEQPTVTQSIQVDPQPTVMEKIKMTKRILDKSKAAPVASSSAAEPASRSFADVGQVGQAASSASPVVEPASRGFSCGGRPLEKRPRHETAVDDDFDDDKMFLLSLCGKMKHLSPANNMQFRLGVQQLLFDLLRSESQTNLQNGSRSGNAFYTPATAQINPVSSSSVSSFSEVLIKEEVEETLTDESPLMVDESFPDEVKTEENSTERYSDNSGNMDYN